jgi:long-chain acyl-CoA synthetase
MFLRDTILEALDNFENSKIIDTASKKEYSYGGIKKAFEKLDKSFIGINFEGKIMVFDFNENSINSIILYLYMLVKKAVPVILELSNTHVTLLNDLPYYGIIKNKLSILEQDSDVLFELYETPFGVVSLRNYLGDFKYDTNCCLLLTSSGTSGGKKIIKCGSKEIIANIKANINALSISDKDCTLLCLPIYYSYSLIGQFFSHLIQGATIIVVPYKFISFNLVDLLNHYKPTNFFTTPTQVNLLLGFVTIPGATNGLRFIAIGGGFLNRFSFFKFSKKFGAEVYYKTYGITEAGPRVATYAIDKTDVKNFEPNYIGKPLENVSLIMGQKMGFYKEFEVSKLQISTPSLYKGYLNSVDVESNSILETEDVVYYNKNEVHILGRKSDFYSFGLTEFWGFELEELLFERISGMVKIKIQKNLENLHIGVMKHPKMQIDYNLIREQICNNYKRIPAKNVIIENYNEQLEFTK